MTDLDEALERVDTLLSLEEAIDPDRVYMREWRPAVVALSVIRAELAALREEAQLGRALYDALTEDSTRWVRTDGEENKLAVAVANARRHYE